MATYLTQEWLDLQQELAADLPERPGASARIQYVVTGGPDGEVRYTIVLDDGRIVAATLGDDPEADLTLTTPHEVALRILRGELDANTAYMQGKVKTAGDNGILLRLLPLVQSPGYQAAQRALADQTEA